MSEPWLLILKTYFAEALADGFTVEEAMQIATARGELLLAEVQADIEVMHHAAR